MSQVQDTRAENFEIPLSLFLLVPCNKEKINKNAYFIICLLLNRPRLNVCDTKLITGLLRELHQLHGKRGHQVSMTSSPSKILRADKEPERNGICMTQHYLHDKKTLFPQALKVQHRDF